MSGKPGRSGRRPKPTQLLKLSGTFRPDRHAGRKNEPRPGPADLRPPAWVTGRAKRLWTSLAAKLSKAGVLTVADVPLFAAFCCEMASYIEMTSDPDAKTTDRMRVLKAACDIGGLFGLNPSSRSGLRIEPQEESLEELLDRTRHLWAKPEKKHG